MPVAVSAGEGGCLSFWNRSWKAVTSRQKYTSCSEADGRARRSVCLCASYLPLAQNSPAKSDRFWGWHILIPFRTPRDGEAKPALLHCVFLLTIRPTMHPGSSHSAPGHVTLVSLVAWLPQGPPACGWESGNEGGSLRPLFLAGILSSAGLLLICC